MSSIGNYFNNEKAFTFIRGFAMGRHWNEVLRAMNFARDCHADQKRKSGEPYIIHPLLMGCQALAMGLEDQSVISTLLLHDVVEDCDASVNDLPVSQKVKDAVDLLSFRKPAVYFEKDGEGVHLSDVKREYYKKISENGIASICKIIDRCNNVSTMAGVFTQKKLKEYIEETEEFIFPLLNSTKHNFPEYQNMVFLLKFQIVAILNSIKPFVKEEPDVPIDGVS